MLEDEWVLALALGGVSGSTAPEEDDDRAEVPTASTAAADSEAASRPTASGGRSSPRGAGPAPFTARSVVADEAVSAGCFASGDSPDQGRRDKMMMHATAITAPTAPLMAATFVSLFTCSVGMGGGRSVVVSVTAVT